MSQYILKEEDEKRLTSVLGRSPKVLERVLALALWNEHCSYRSSRIHLRKFGFSTSKKVTGLGEQAGVVDLGKGERISFKMESHNHPSFITPYQGASTGVGGILRDIFAMGARPIALADFLCFGEEESYEALSRVDQVIRGIGDYGNCMGIPTITGKTIFDKSYDKNILVNAMAIGFLGKKDQEMSSKTKTPGNLVIYVGSATGRDGILGADMASKSFEEEEEDKKTTVQIGDPFFGKNLMEATLLAMKKGLIEACQDMGAAGLTCSSFEMSEKSGLGLSLHLDKAPLRDKSMGLEEILLSESQERMLFVCSPKNWKELKKLCNDFSLEAEVLGEVLKEKEMKLYWKGECVLTIDPKIYTENAPIEKREFEESLEVKRSEIKEGKIKEKETLFKSLSSKKSCSRKFIYSQYDQRVGTLTKKDASYPIAVLELPETRRELGIAIGCRPSLMELDPLQGAKDACFYPALNLSLRGFEPMAVTDCLNFGNPEKKSVMSDFVCCVDNIAKACKTLDIPVVSGNVSFYNESEVQGKDINITPTPVIGMIGLKESKKALPEARFKKEGEKAYLVYSHQLFLSHDRKQIYGALQDSLLKLFVDQTRKLFLNSNFSSAVVVGEKGLAHTLSKMLVEEKVGFQVSKDFPFSLFDQRLYEVIVSVEEKEEESFIQNLKALGLDFQFLGETTSEKKLHLKEEKIKLLDIKSQYFKAWEGRLSL